MKKLAIVFAIILASVTAKAQEPVIFKLKFLPDHKYNASMKMAMGMHTIALRAQKVKSVKAKPQSTDTKMEMTMKFDITTGPVVPANSFPVTMKYEDMTMKMVMNDKVMPSAKNPLVGQVIYGQSDLEGKFQIDSISGMGANEQMKTMMTTMINKIQGQVVFPEHPLNIGGSFTQEMPINIPAGDMIMDMKAKMIYKLISIKANLAYFDTDITMKFDVDMPKNGGIKMAGNGSGKGQMIYNIGENYFNSMSQTMTMTYNMIMGDKGKMTSKMDMTTDVENVISRN
ncbi:MAG: hypothetical protein JWR50_3245 [Mucilaginibacter sp.]|nr:hypothetical protein [Mucilaginibacter sp.]